MKDTIRRTARWLSDIAPLTADAGARTVVAGYICLGICRELLIRERCEFLTNIESFHRVLDSMYIEALANCESDLILLCSVMQKYHYGVPMPILDDYAHTVLASLNARAGANLSVDDYSAAYLLFRLGLCDQPKLLKFTWEDVDGSLLAERGLKIVQLAWQVMAQTAFGAHNVVLPPALLPILHVASLSALKAYEYDVACSLMRASSCLGGLDQLAVRLARGFIVENQNCDGSFGFLARELSQLEKEQDVRRCLDLQISVALACVWILAETSSTPYRLYRDSTSKLN